MIISRLEEVKRLKFQIKLLNEKIKELKSSLEIQGIRYSDLPKVEGFKSNITELQIERLLELQTKKYHLQIKIDDILEELSKLPELSYKVIYYRHIDGLRWIDISKKIGYSISQCHRFYAVAQSFNL